MDTIQEIKVSDIILGDNARIISKKEIVKSDLYASIKAVGMRVPITVKPNGKPGKFVLVSGYRRHACATEQKIETIKCHVLDSDNADSAIHNYIENACREDLDPLEQGEAAKLLNEKLGDKKMTALALGISISTLVKRLQLSNLSPAWKKQVRNPVDDYGEHHEVPLTSLDLVCTLDHAVQDDILQSCSGFDPQAIKECINRKLCELKHAKFNVGECEPCQFRSDKNELFPEYEKSPRCLKPACFAAKNENVRQAILDDYVAKNPGGILLSMNKLEDSKGCKVFNKYNVDKPTEKNKAKAVKALDVDTGKISMVIVPEDTKPSSGGGPKPMAEKKVSLNLRRVNEARGILYTLVDKMKARPAHITDQDVVRMVYMFGTTDSETMAYAKHWKIMTERTFVQIYDSLFISVLGILSQRLAWNRPASQLSDEMEGECIACAAWLKIDWKPIWEKALIAHPVPKSWTKKGETSQITKKQAESLKSK